jgi:hypothetical protein
MSTTTVSAALLPATLAQANEYYSLFINRKIHVQQTFRPNNKGRFYFYKVCDRTPEKRPVALTASLVQSHLAGKRTIGFYAINPDTQNSKWIAIDADYDEARRHLLALRQAFRDDGIVSLMEQSRRGGHLWIFFATPLSAALCRLYVLNVARRLNIAIKQGETVPGLEIFPRQNSLLPEEFGNAIRGPLGIHRASGLRYWFEDAEANLAAQLEMLRQLPKVAEEQLVALTAGLAPIEDPALTAQPGAMAGVHGGNFRSSNHFARSSRSSFDILARLESLGIPFQRKGREYKAKCPCCGKKDRLSINVANPDKYQCWTHCTSADIREALGCPVSYRARLAA